MSKETNPKLLPCKCGTQPDIFREFGEGPNAYRVVVKCPMCGRATRSNDCNTPEQDDIAWNRTAKWWNEVRDTRQ